MCNYCYYQSGYTDSHAEKEIPPAALHRKVLEDCTEKESILPVFTAVSMSALHSPQIQ